MSSERAASQPTRITAGHVIETANCERCGAEFEREVVMVDSRGFRGARNCESCQVIVDAEVMAKRAEGRMLQERIALEDDQFRAKTATERKRSDLDVPPDYENATLQNWQLHGADADARIRQQRIQAAGLRFLSEWPTVHQRLLVLRGGVGTGKGHWCWSIAKAVVERGDSARVVKLADLVRELRRSWKSKQVETEEATLQRYRKLDLLVIDEVSRHAFYGENIHQHLYDVLDNRTEYHRPTVLTSNERNDVLGEILRPALWSRIHGNGGVLEFGEGPDFRKSPKGTP